MIGMSDLRLTAKKIWSTLKHNLTNTEVELLLGHSASAHRVFLPAGSFGRCHPSCLLHSRPLSGGGPIPSPVCQKTREEPLWVGRP